MSLAYLEAVEGPQRVTDNGIAIQEHIISGGRKNRPGRDTNLDTYITITRPATRPRVPTPRPTGPTWTAPPGRMIW